MNESERGLLICLSQNDPCDMWLPQHCCPAVVPILQRLEVPSIHLHYSQHVHFSHELPCSQLRDSALLVKTLFCPVKQTWFHKGMRLRVMTRMEEAYTHFLQTWEMAPSLGHLSPSSSSSFSPSLSLPLATLTKEGHIGEQQVWLWQLTMETQCWPWRHTSHGLWAPSWRQHSPPHLLVELTAH